MTIRKRTDWNYSWSADLQSELLLNDHGLTWLEGAVELLVSTSVGAAEVDRSGPTAFYVVEVPTEYLRGYRRDPELVVVEVTEVDAVGGVLVRPVAAGNEPTVGEAGVGVVV